MKTDQEMREQCSYWGRNSIDRLTFCTFNDKIRVSITEQKCENCDHFKARKKFFNKINNKRR